MKGRRSGEVGAQDRRRVDLGAPRIHCGSRERQRKMLVGWRSRGREGLEQVPPASSHHPHHLLISKRDSLNPSSNSVLPLDLSLLHSAGRECSRQASVGTATDAGCSAQHLVLLNQALPQRCKAAQREVVGWLAGETAEEVDLQPPVPVPAGTQVLPGRAEEVSSPDPLSAGCCRRN